MNARGWLVFVLMVMVLAALALAGTALGDVAPAGQVEGQRTAQADGVWDSGWVAIATDTAMAFTHNLGGDPGLYAVDLWFRDTRQPGLGIHHRAYGGMDVGGQRFGVHWQNLTDTGIRVFRHRDDMAAGQVRLRIWIPDPPEYDSGWRDIQPGQAITLTHNLSGDVDDYTVGIKFRDTSPDGRGIHQFAIGGLETGGAFHGAAWRSLTDTSIVVWRYPDDTSVHQVRVFITRPDPPDYDSGWVDIATDTVRTLTHNLGGNPNSYLVRAAARSTVPGGPGINTRAAGGMEVGGQFFGANWQNLTDTRINFFRQPNDPSADQVRVRIWRPDFYIYLPVIVRDYLGEQELAYDDGTMETTDSWETGKGFAVRFTPPVDQVQVMRARYYLQDPRPVEVHVWDANHTDLITPFTVAASQDGWNNVDLSAYNITVSGDFYVGFTHLEDYRPTLGVDTAASDGRSFEVDGGYWEQQFSDYMIRAVVVQR